MSVPFGLETSVDHGTRPRSASSVRGLSIERRFTAALRGQDPLEATRYEKRRSVISNPDGSTVFSMDDAEVPSDWSQLATDIIVSKYFRKTEVPLASGGMGSEHSAKQVCRRLALAIRKSGEKLGAFNSPAWFNCGLAEAYGITGKPVGNWFWNPETGRVEETKDAYSHPQISACFIQSISDDLMDIAAGIQREMRLFKFGSGTGTNFSSIRAEGELL